MFKQQREKKTESMEINFKEINESFLGAFGWKIKYILQRMFGGSPIPVRVRGTEKQVTSFADTLVKEKDYMKNYIKFGLDNPQTYKSKYKLNNAISGFEKATGLTWPFK